MLEQASVRPRAPESKDRSRWHSRTLHAAARHQRRTRALSLTERPSLCCTPSALAALQTPQIRCRHHFRP
jgi:hypothetical protein